MPRSSRVHCDGVVPGLTAALFLVTQGAQAQVVEFGDDFETGTLLTSDAPAGRWTSRSNAGVGAPVTSSPAAAHRGQRGARVADTTVGGPGSLEFLNAVLTTRTGDAYVRTWLRLTSPTSASNYPLGLFSGLGQQCTTEASSTAARGTSTATPSRAPTAAPRRRSR